MSSSLAFVEGYAHVLIDQGVRNSLVNNMDWLLSENILGILAEHQGEVIGGVLVYKKTDNKKLPMEELLESEHAGNSLLKDWGNTHDPLGEVFAVWHSKKAAGWGISYVLLKSGVALAARQGIKTTLYLVSDYNQRLVQSLGLVSLKKNNMEVYFYIGEGEFMSRSFVYLYKNELPQSIKKSIVSQLINTGTMQKRESILGKQLDIDYRLF
jgi:hypothetical protein